MLVAEFAIIVVIEIYLQLLRHIGLISMKLLDNILSPQAFRPKLYDFVELDVVISLYQCGSFIDGTHSTFANVSN